MELLGYISAVIMGATLGLIGGGGSILTVPILAYLFELPAVASTGYSLFIVGLSALIGSYQYHKKGLINYKVGGIFMLPAIVGVYSARKFAVPSLPEEFVNIGSWVLTKDVFIMGLFAIIMLLASVTMIKGRKQTQATEKKFNYPLITLEGLGVGFLTGVVGAGGGFLIIPALVLLAGLEMKTAVGTSLLIISIKSLFGFMGDIQTQPNIDWTFLMSFSILSILGIFIGSYFSTKVPANNLKRGFGYFAFIMGIFILYKQF